MADSVNLDRYKKLSLRHFLTQYLEIFYKLRLLNKQMNKIIKTFTFNIHI